MKHEFSNASTVLEHVREVAEEVETTGKPASAVVSVKADFIDGLKKMLFDFFFQDIAEPSERAKVAEAFDVPMTKNLVRVSAQDIFRACTGDLALTGRVPVREAMDTTLATSLLVEAMNTRMVVSFRSNPAFESWKGFTKIVARNDFKTGAALTLGGFTGYATKTKGSAFASITETGARSEEYALLTKGGIFDVAFEDIRNDDVGYIAGLPTRLGQYAARMLSAFLWDFVTSNPVLTADSTAVFHGDHDNLMTSALDATALSAAIGLLQSQTYPNSSDKMGTVPRYIATSMDVAQRQAAYNLTREGYGLSNNVPTFAQSFGLVPIVNPHTADATDWYLFADPMEVPSIVCGFLDGRVEPEITSAMSSGVGDWFTKRVAQFRIAHDYGATWGDYRGAVASIVAD